MSQRLAPGRQPERRQARDARRQRPERRGRAAALAMEVDTESPEPLDAERAVRDLRLPVETARMWRERWQHGLFDVDPIERTVGQRTHAALDADARRRPSDQQQVAA